jgi:type IV pilus assembly protein PilA
MGRFRQDSPLKRSDGFTLIELLIVVAIIGIIAAIAIPSLLRARVSANEAATIADIRTVLSAQAAYHTANSGYYGQLNCLSAPGTAACIPGYIGPSFLDASVGAAVVTKSGYGRGATYLGAGTGPQPGDVASYCYFATPTSQNQTGVRSFGGDSSAVVATANGPVQCCGTGALDLVACTALR